MQISLCHESQIFKILYLILRKPFFLVENYNGKQPIPTKKISRGPFLVIAL